MRKKELSSRQLLIFESRATAIDFCVDFFLKESEMCLSQTGHFSVALSGGKTPLPFFQKLFGDDRFLALSAKDLEIFWGDERVVAPTDLESNFKTAMDAGLKRFRMLERRTHRMVVEGDLTVCARAYESLLRKKAPLGLDLVLLGVGEDGHTASLFPRTLALKEETAWVVANDVPQKHCSRLTLTIPCLNKARRIIFFAWGREKAPILSRLFSEETAENLPAALVGSLNNPAIWITDEEGASLLQEALDRS